MKILHRSRNKLDEWPPLHREKWIVGGISTRSISRPLIHSKLPRPEKLKISQNFQVLLHYFQLSFSLRPISRTTRKMEESSPPVISSIIYFEGLMFISCNKSLKKRITEERGSWRSCCSNYPVFLVSLDKNVYSLMSMNFVFQEKCCGYFDIFLPVFRSPTL